MVGKAMAADLPEYTIAQLQDLYDLGNKARRFRLNPEVSILRPEWPTRRTSTSHASNAYGQVGNRIEGG
jgi:hypothetical protein